MAGFFEQLRDMIVGKPANRPEDQIPKGDFQISGVTEGVRKHDLSTFPVVRVRRVITHINRNEMEVACEIENQSDMRVVLSRFRVLGREIRMTDDLRPGQSHEYQIYRGPLLKNKQGDMAVLQYRTAEGGDYFEASFDIRFTYHQNENAYSLDEMRLHGPIRDIYG